MALIHIFGLSLGPVIEIAVEIVLYKVALQTGKEKEEPFEPLYSWIRSSNSKDLIYRARESGGVLDIKQVMGYFFPDQAESLNILIDKSVRRDEGTNQEATILNPIFGEDEHSSVNEPELRPLAVRGGLERYEYFELHGYFDSPDSVFEFATTSRGFDHDDSEPNISKTLGNLSDPHLQSTSRELTGHPYLSHCMNSNSSSLESHNTAPEN